MYYRKKIPYRFHPSTYIHLYPKSIISATPLQVNNGFYYTIQPGDTIYSISQIYNVSMNDIIEYNNITVPYVIYPGQRIYIPREPTPIPPTGGRIYIVDQGDTLFSIAINYNSNVETIAEINNIDNPDLIYPGQRLIIPAT